MQPFTLQLVHRECIWNIRNLERLLIGKHHCNFTVPCTAVCSNLKKLPNPVCPNFMPASSRHLTRALIANIQWRTMLQANTLHLQAQKNKYKLVQWARPPMRFKEVQSFVFLESFPAGKEPCEPVCHRESSAHAPSQKQRSIPQQKTVWCHFRKNTQTFGGSQPSYVNTNTVQRLAVASLNAEWSCAGVPQGTFFSPLGFALGLHVNKLWTRLSTYKYVDDNPVWEAFDLSGNDSQLQQASEEVSRWDSWQQDVHEQC